MRFARLTCSPDRVDEKLCDWALSAELDLLQLDYPRPHAQPAAAATPPPLPDYAPATPAQLGTLGRLFFLTPETRVITSGGWAHAYGCAEAIGQQLVDAGAQDVLITAIRGSYLLPILEDLRASGAELHHLETGASLHELRAPLVAADLALGAGPIATAMTEGSRVIVAGCFDPCSPAIAGGVALHDWAWDDRDRLAAAACVARGVLAPMSRTELAAAFDKHQWRPRRALLAPAGDASIECSEMIAAEVDELAEWLAQGWRDDPVTADVACDADQLDLQLAAGNQLKIRGVRGRPAPDRWKLDLLYFDGFAVDITVIQRDASDDDEPLKTIQGYVTSLETARRTVASELLAQPGGRSLLRIHVQSDQYGSCRQAADEIDNLIGCCSGQLEGLGPATVTARYAIWPTAVPRDAVDIAVDTRPATEWL